MSEHHLVEIDWEWVVEYLKQGISSRDIDDVDEVLAILRFCHNLKGKFKTNNRLSCQKLVDAMCALHRVRDSLSKVDETITPKQYYSITRSSLTKIDKAMSDIRLFMPNSYPPENQEVEDDS